MSCLRLHSLHDPGSLIWQILGTRHLRATVAKDHIYGMLGMVDEKSKSQIAIDYSASDAGVFANAVKVAIRTSGWPAALPRLWEVYDRVPTSIADLPSWCSDLSNAINLLPVHSLEWGPSEDATNKYNEFGRIDLSGTWTKIGFNGLPLDVVKQRVNRRVILDTAEIARVRQTTEPEEQFKEILKVYARSEIWEWVESLKASLPWRGADDEVCHAERIRMLYHPFDLNPVRPLVADTEHAELLDATYMLCHILHSQGSEPLLALRERNGAFAEVAKQSFEVLVRQRGRYIFETASGKLGFCYRPVDLDDQVVLVPGGWHAHMISADSQRYVGCAYMEEYANDTILHSQISQAREWKMFYLL